MAVGAAGVVVLCCCDGSSFAFRCIGYKLQLHTVVLYSIIGAMSGAHVSPAAIVGSHRWESPFIILSY